MNPAAIIEAIPEVLDALNQLRDTLMGVVNAVLPFVQAIAPSVVLEFNQAMRDLQATIGSRLHRRGAGRGKCVVREIAGRSSASTSATHAHLQHGRERGRATFRRCGSCAHRADSALTPILDILVSLSAEYAKFLDDLVMISTAMAKVFTTFLQSLFGTDASGIKDTFRAFFDVLRQAVKAVLTFAATLAVAFGQAGLVEQFAFALATEAKEREDKASGLKAAATNPQMIDVAGIARQSQLAAFTAAGGAGTVEKTDTEYLKELAGTLNDIASKNETIEDALKKWWNERVMGDPVFGQVMSLALSLYRYLDGIKDRIGRFFR